MQTSAVAHPVFYAVSTGTLFRRQSGQGVALTTHLHLVPRIAFMSCSRRTLPVFTLTLLSLDWQRLCTSVQLLYTWDTVIFLVSCLLKPPFKHTTCPIFMAFLDQFMVYFRISTPCKSKYEDQIVYYLPIIQKHQHNGHRTDHNFHQKGRHKTTLTERPGVLIHKM